MKIAKSNYIPISASFICSFRTHILSILLNIPDKWNYLKLTIINSIKYLIKYAYSFVHYSRCKHCWNSYCTHIWQHNKQPSGWCIYIQMTK